MEDAANEVRLDLKRRFADFLEAQHGDGPGDAYAAAAAQLLDPGSSMTKRGVGGATVASGGGGRRLVIDTHHLRAYDPELLARLLERPAEALPALQDAVRDLVAGLPGQLDALKSADAPDEELFVGFRGDFGPAEVSPRQLLSPLLGRLVKVTGIVTRCVHHGGC